MALDRCIAEQIAKGELDPKRGDYIRGLYEKLKQRHREQFGDATAEALASEEALAAAKADLLKRKQRAFLQIKAQRAALDDILSYRGRDGEWEFGQAAGALLVRDERAPFSNVEYRGRVIHQRALGKLSELIEHHSRNIVGEVRDKAGLFDLAQEAFGESSGNANAAVYASAWGDVANMLRQRANAAGANIGKLERWGLPQSHDAAAVRQAAGPGRTMDEAFAAWRQAELPRLDRARMIDHEINQPLNDADLDKLLRTVFDNIVSEGWAKREPGAGGGGAGSIANRHGQHRVLIYRDAASWVDSHAQFGGTATIFDAMMGHVHSMSRDIALMERLGPNPAATVRWLKDVVTQKAMKEDGAGELADKAAFKAVNRIAGLYDTMSGANRRPESRRLALIGETLRTFQVATKLGSAVLSTTSDVVTGALTRAYNDLPMTGIITGYIKHLNPASAADRQHAARTGFIAEQAGTSLSGTARFLSEEFGQETVRRLAEGTMRLSGLNAITEAGRQTHGMGMLSHMTRERAKTFEKLDDGFRGMFERYGLDAADWEAIRATPVEEVAGAPWIKPDRFEDQELADRVMEMIYQEMDVAVPTAGVEQRAMLDRVAPKGTWFGETIRTGFQFKAFPVTLMMVQWQRAMARDTNAERLMAFGMFFGASALAGAMALQMKELSKGRNARPMMSGGFLLEAISQGGGAGIYGDFARSTESRFNSGPTQVLAGPAMQTIANVGSLTVGNAIAAAKGERTHVQRDLHAIARSEVPIASSLWYTRLAYERAALDVWRRAGDPNGGDAFARMERKYARDYNQSYWWGPGDAAPESAPRLDTALDGGPAARASPQGAGW